jgi:peptidyl-prolyl cis-trans isomerase B (cyclophilin B)
MGALGSAPNGGTTHMVGLRNDFKNSSLGILVALGAALCLIPLNAAADHHSDAADHHEASVDENGAAEDAINAAADAKSVVDQEISVGGDPAIAAIDAFIAKQNVDKSQADWKEQVKAPPIVSFASNKSYYWNLKTNKGKIKIQFMPKVAPYHVGSTIYLTRMGFYNDTEFHRVITGFMAQGGDPTGTGRGGPGYRYAGEFDPDVKHDKPGILSMANAGPETDGSQFFITFTRTHSLDGKHTIFGEVVEGMPTVDRLEKAGSKRGNPKRPLFIERATISVE